MSLDRPSLITMGLHHVYIKVYLELLHSSILSSFSKSLVDNQWSVDHQWSVEA